MIVKHPTVLLFKDGQLHAEQAAGIVEGGGVAMHGFHPRVGRGVRFTRDVDGGADQLWQDWHGADMLQSVMRKSVVEVPSRYDDVAIRIDIMDGFSEPLLDQFTSGGAQFFGGVSGKFGRLHDWHAAGGEVGRERKITRAAALGEAHPRERALLCICAGTRTVPLLAAALRASGASFWRRSRARVAIWPGLSWVCCARLSLMRVRSSLGVPPAE